MIQAGFAQVEITPRAPADLAGYFNRRRSTGVLDPLHARAAVLDDGSTRVALAVVDLIGVPIGLVDDLRERLGEAFPHLLVVATHTHTAPAVFPIFEPEPQHDYIQSVALPGIESACRAAAQALRLVEPRIIDRRACGSAGLGIRLTRPRLRRDSPSATVTASRGPAASGNLFDKPDRIHAAETSKLQNQQARRRPFGPGHGKGTRDGFARR